MNRYRYAMSLLVLALIMTGTGLDSIEAIDTDGCHSSASCYMRDVPEVVSVEQNMEWFFEPVDVHESIYRYNNRWMTLDDSNQPHLAFGAAYLYYATKDGDNWNVEIIDEDASVGAGASIALDSIGRPHIAYYDGNNEAIKYATKLGSDWYSYRVGDTNYSAPVQGISIALDSNDLPGIAYFSAYTQSHPVALQFARPISTNNWAIEVVEASYNLWWPSAVFAEQDIPMIAYSDRTDGEVVLAIRGANDWDLQTVATSGEDIYFPSLALNQSNLPRIAVNLNSKLAYAEWTGSEWIVEEITGVDGYSSASLALGSQGQPHIVAKDIYATRIGDQWTVEANSFGNYGSIDVNSDGHPAVSFVGHDDVLDVNTIRYAHLHEGIWSSETVLQRDDSFVGQKGFDIEIDRAHDIHASYLESNYDILMYAKEDSGSWQISGIAQANPEASSSLATDSLNRPSIAYHGLHGDETVDLAQWTGSDWITMTVDTATTDNPVVVRIDDQDNLHLGYVDGTLRYAQWNGSEWQFHSLDTSNLGPSFDMDLDNLGRPNFMYCESSNLREAHWNGSQWEYYTIAWNCPLRRISMEIDQNNNIHAAFQYDSSGIVLYASKINDWWDLEPIETVYAYVNVSLAINRNGNPGVAMHVEGMWQGGYLRYAERVDDAWQVVDVGKTKVRDIALEYNESGWPIIAHTNLPGGGLYLAEYRSSERKIFLPFLTGA